MKCIANHKILWFGLILFAILLSACEADQSSKQIKTNTLKENRLGDKIIIYQLLPRLFTNENSTRKTYGSIEENACGKFNQITTDVLHKIKSLGITYIWFTGVLEHACMTDYSAYGIAVDDPDVVKGRAGSPYAIKDYYDVDPDLAEEVPNRMKEWEDLIKRTHEAGMGIIMDFVPNHVARSYHSDVKPQGTIDLGATDDTGKAFDPQNNFYYLPGQHFIVPQDYNPLDTFDSLPGEDGRFAESPAKASGNNVFNNAPAINDWFETVKLNYGIDYQNGNTKYFDSIPDTWIKMKDILHFWAQKGVDGFRCDMAGMVPVEFWHWAIGKLKEDFPNLIFIAEIYNPGLYQSFIAQGHFDYLYDKVGLYDTLRSLTCGQSSISSLSSIHASMENIDNHLLRFLENHDEQRIASSYFANDPDKAKAAMGVVATLGRGPVLIYAGQELGEQAKGIEGFSKDDGRTSIFDYWSVPTLQAWLNHGIVDGGLLDENQISLRAWYSQLLKLAATDTVFTLGQTIDLSESLSYIPAQAPVFAYARYTRNRVLLCFANFSESNIDISLNIPALILEQLHVSTMPENLYLLFGNSWFDNESLVLHITPWDFDVIQLK